MARLTRKKLVIALLIIAFFIISSVLFLQPRPVLQFLAARSPDVLYFVPVDERVVALTIDDAPHPMVTPRLLDVLKDNGAHATFFVIGDHARGNEHILRRARSEGHELGNHLAREHPSIWLSAAQFEQELAEVDSIIAPLPGRTKWFRPGSGWYSRRMLDQAKSHRYRCALGSVYPFDTIIRNRRVMATYIRNRVFPGAVIILHDGKPDRVRSALVLSDVLPDLKTAGYRVVTLSELVQTGRHRGP
ncbi:MAG: peptidoglycan-N-acetylglucosamine deacetylase [Acidobacteria bacterium]|nr:MAG: peptidoglycan-N-acetylglucosamine deacetylase [Acidobacteriota bacterium]